MILLWIAVLFLARPALMLVHILLVTATQTRQNTTGIKLLIGGLVMSVNQAAIVVLSVLLYDDYQSLVKVIAVMLILGTFQGFVQHFIIKAVVWWSTSEPRPPVVRVSNHRSVPWNNPGSTPPPDWAGNDDS